MTAKTIQTARFPKPEPTYPVPNQCLSERPNLNAVGRLPNGSIADIAILKSSQC